MISNGFNRKILFLDCTALPEETAPIFPVTDRQKFAWRMFILLHLQRTYSCSAGSVVIELLPYNWDWEGASTLYKNLTESMEDISYYSWKANTADTAVYMSEKEAFYQNWTVEECTSPWALHLTMIHSNIFMNLSPAIIDHALGPSDCLANLLEFEICEVSLFC